MLLELYYTLYGRDTPRCLMPNLYDKEQRERSERGDEREEGEKRCERN